MKAVERFSCEVLLEPETDELKFLPEGPYPVDETCLSWVAIQHGAESKHGSFNLLSLESKRNQSHPLHGRPGFAFATNRPNVFVIGQEHEIGLFDLADRSWQPLVQEIDHGVSGTIINDGVICGQGIIFGCKDLKFAEKKGGLYYFNGRSRDLHRLRSDQICSNGKVVLQNETSICFLDIDTPTKKVVEYRLGGEGERIESERVVLDLTAETSFPDGMIATPDGSGVIISMYNPHPAEYGETRWYDLASGELRAIWETPASPQATCPQLIAWQGEVRIVITTAVEHMPPERRFVSRNAGALFWGKTPFTSLPPTPVFQI